MDELDIFNKIKIGVASDEKIREWSKGEVKKPETINVTVVNIKELDIKGLFVIDVVLK